jgi:uncharacterized protein (DUF2267 family)
MATENRIDAFDTSLRESNDWLADVMRETGLGQRQALAALRAVLHAIRDETTIRQSSMFVAGMPAQIRGLYFEDWDPSRRPIVCHSPQYLFDRIRSYVADSGTDIEPARIARAVFAVLERRMPGPTLKIKRMLPGELHVLWPTTGAERTLEREERHADEQRLAVTEALHAEAGHERGAPLAPVQNRAPGERHRGGPLPNTM